MSKKRKKSKNGCVTLMHGISFLDGSGKDDSIFMSFLDEKVKDTMDGAIVSKNKEIAPPINTVSITPKATADLVMMSYSDVLDSLIRFKKSQPEKEFTIIKIVDKKKASRVFEDDRFLSPLNISSTLSDVVSNLGPIWNNVNTDIPLTPDDNCDNSVETSAENIGVFYAPKICIYRNIFDMKRRYYLKEPVIINVLVLSVDDYEEKTIEDMRSEILRLYGIFEKLQIKNPIIDPFSYPCKKEQRSDVAVAWIDSLAEQAVNGKYFESMVFLTDTTKKYEIFASATTATNSINMHF